MPRRQHDELFAVAGEEWVRGTTSAPACRWAAAKAGSNSRWDAAKRRETRVVRKTLFRATSTHIGVLATDFDFGGDPATGLVRIRMVPPFG
jgi:hypothetical protein